MSDIHFVHYVSDQSARHGYSVMKTEVQSRTPRPMNSWILFRAQKLRDFKNLDPDFKEPQGVTSKIVADLWRKATPETKQIYEDLAKNCRKEHAIKYPNYKFKVRAKGLCLKLKTSYSLDNPGLSSSSSSSSPTTSRASSISPTWSDSFDTSQWPSSTGAELPSNYSLPYPHTVESSSSLPPSESLWCSTWNSEGLADDVYGPSPVPTVFGTEWDVDYFTPLPAQDYSYHEQQRLLSEQLLEIYEQQKWQTHLQ